MNKISSDWGNSIKTFYPSYYPIWSNPQEHFKALIEDWNYLDAVKFLDWDKITNYRTNLKVLDLGAGTGWLSAFLSRYENIGSIDVHDSDEENLNSMLAEIIKMMDGDFSKINPIKGLFHPLLVEDDYYDLVVASSALHHADNLFPLMRELKRVIKKGCKLYILNETPYSFRNHYITLLKNCFFILIKTLRKNFNEFEQTISAGHILSNPYLGDRKYAYFQWIRAITQAGFKYKTILTPFFPDKKKKPKKPS